MVFVLVGLTLVIVLVGLILMHMYREEAEMLKPPPITLLDQYRFHKEETDKIERLIRDEINKQTMLPPHLFTDVAKSLREDNQELPKRW